MNPQRAQVLLFLILLYISFQSLCLCFSSEFSIVNQTPDSYISEEQALELFKQWIENNDKVYKHEDETKQRFENFRTNLRFVLEKNMKIKSDSSGSKHVVGLNKFADMSNEEFRQVYLSKVKKPVKSVLGLKKKKKTLTCDAPSTLDWRTKGVVTGVKDQGQCGSCWAFSSIGAIEAVNAIVTGDLISLSEQELVDCDMKDEGCNGGYMDTAFEWVIGNGGINTESGYPYTGVDQSCKTAKEQINVVSIDSYEDISPEESALVCALLTQPISVGIDGGTRDFQLYTGGVYAGECSSNPDDIDHAVLVVGYGSEGDEDYWIAKNSWGTSWGMEGYIYIKKNTSLEYGVCAINAMASYPTKGPVSPSPFPSPSTPPPPSSPTPKPPSPPPPPSPTPSKCGKFHYCQPGRTCCCIFEFYDYCFAYGCCGYENAVCCEGTRYCCPQDYPICDVEEGTCYKLYGDYVGVAAKKRSIAKHKLPWTMYEKAEDEYQPLRWKRNQVGVMR